jgi:hypothetical protein
MIKVPFFNYVTKVKVIPNLACRRYFNNYFTILCLLAGESLGPVTMAGRELHAQLFDIHFNTMKNTYRSVFLKMIMNGQTSSRYNVEYCRNAAFNNKAQKSGRQMFF